mmetsp:Transcript_41913/g.91274  ORF Transcript_41913/g.91274 Transcript_41913/m.91274 type:complete len:442 (+) Transcript_41913:131-1456(+)
MTTSSTMSTTNLVSITALVATGWVMMELDLLEPMSSVHLAAMMVGSVLYALIMGAIPGASSIPKRKLEHWEVDNSYVADPKPRSARAPVRMPRTSAPVRVGWEEDKAHPTITTAPIPTGFHDDTVQRVLKGLKPALPETKDRIKRVTMEAKTAINSVISSAKVFAFGAAFNGFGSSNHDVDLNVLVTSSQYTLEKDVVPALQGAGFKFVEYREATNGQQIAVFQDSSSRAAVVVRLNDVLSLISTKLMRQYSLLDRRTHEVALLFKQWLRRNGLQGVVGSFAALNLVIFYMQAQGLLPSLQELAKERGARLAQWAAESPSWRDAAKRCPEAQDVVLHFVDAASREQTISTTAGPSSREILQGLFKFLGSEFDWDREVISVRLGRRVARLPTAAAVLVEDPVNPCANLMEATPEQLAAFQQACTEAAIALCDGSVRMLCKQL